MIRSIQTQNNRNQMIKMTTQLLIITIIQIRYNLMRLCSFFLCLTPFLHNSCCHMHINLSITADENRVILWIFFSEKIHVDVYLMGRTIQWQTVSFLLILRFPFRQAREKAFIQIIIVSILGAWQNVLFLRNIENYIQSQTNTKEKK